MNNQQTLSIDCTREEDYLNFYPNESLVKVYKTGLPGKGLIYASHPACEYIESYAPQNGIVVHLKAERNSLRKVGDSVEVENPNVGDMAIIPANVIH